ncbi:MAG: hypothetical protein WCW56_00185 [Candidatus Paceibacterota bacterium]|jgi:hypothetical protein
MINYKNIFPLVVSLVLVVGSIVSASSPTNPPNCDPAVYPGCNVPVNVGSSAQIKTGNLSLGSNFGLVVGKYIMFNSPSESDSIIGSDGSMLNIVGTGAAGSRIVKISDKLMTTGFAMSGGAPAVNKVLTATDANGNATWRVLFGQNCPAGKFVTGFNADGTLICN